MLLAHSTHDGDMGGVRSLSQKALHNISGQRVVSLQEAVFMVDDQPLILTSDKMTYLSLHKGQEVRREDDDKPTNVISRYRNRPRRHNKLSLDQYFYKVFCRDTFKKESDAFRRKHRMLVPVGMNCKPCYPINYDYARGMLILHKPWTAKRNLNELLKDKMKTIEAFHTMIVNKQVPSSVIAQYTCAVKYANQKKLEIIAKQGLMHRPVDLDAMDPRERDRHLAWQQYSHFTDNKHLDDMIEGQTVDIGKDHDWSVNAYDNNRNVIMDGKDYIEYVKEEYHKAQKVETASLDELNIPIRKDGLAYSIDQLNHEQERIVLAAVDTIIKFLTNDKDYRPLRATVMGCGGTGKSYIINTIISIIRNLTMTNDTVQVAAPSGAAAYNVQGSTLHRLLRIEVGSPAKKMNQTLKQMLMEQLKRLLVLIVDERSQINSMVLASAERNARQCAFGGHNSNELWGGIPVVLLFGDDYQLMPIASEGAIQGYSKQHGSDPHHVTKRSSQAQMLTYQGTHLFTNVMTEAVFALNTNYRVKCNQFRELLGRLRVGKPTRYDARRIMNLHMNNYEGHHDFMEELESSTDTMWLFANNADKNKKNNQKLVHTAKTEGVPMARLECFYDSNREQGGESCRPHITHFRHLNYTEHTDICVGARVAIQTVNHLPEIGLYNGAFGKVVEIAYHDRPLGPNDKEHNHLPDYVVIDIPHLTLPSYIRPWDTNNKTVSATPEDISQFDIYSPSLLITT